LSLAALAPALEVDKLKIQRKEVFEFTEKPHVIREGDKVTVSFAVKDFCDATVAIEDETGKIVRHLASGLLGDNAPPPFQRGALKQIITWDGKNDREEYVDDKDSLTIRVSLGLKPQLERSLYWSPHKLGDNGSEPLTLCAAPEGVYVYDAGGLRGGNTPWLKLFDHDGNYVHTLYPFPAADLEKVKGLQWATYPPDGKKFPWKWGHSQTDLLTHGNLELPWASGGSEDGRRALAVGKDHVYIVSRRLNRLAKPGSGKDSDLAGPVLEIMAPDAERFKNSPVARYVPSSAALSPDEKWLYLTGYRRCYTPGYYQYDEYLSCVTRMPADGSEPPKPLIGQAEMARDKRGFPLPPDGCPLDNPMDVACDKEGRLYVADHVKGLLIFSADGKLLQTVKMEWPARVRVNPDSGEIGVLCWKYLTSRVLAITDVPIFSPQEKYNDNQFLIVKLAPFKDPARAPEVLSTTTGECKPRYVLNYKHAGDIDVFSKSLRVWFCSGWPNGASWNNMNIRILEPAGSAKAKEIRSFDKDTREAVVRNRAPRYGRQRPYFNPADGKLYVAEQIFPTVVADVQCFDQLVKIDPDTGKCSMVDLPFDTEDLAFDTEGHAFLRTDSILVRYDSQTWREVPFDYGEELMGVTHYGLHPSKQVQAGVVFNGGRGASGKLGGMGVNVKGDVACWFYSTAVSNMEGGDLEAGANPENKRGQANIHVKGVKPWTPQIFPGRSTFAFIHVWDKHGKLKVEDAIPGLGECSDIKIDKDNNLYMISNMNRILAGQVHTNRLVNTLIKMGPRKGKILTTGRAAPIPLTDATRPNRPPDAAGISGYDGSVWLEGAEWAVGGLGANSRGLSATACHCEANSGLALDYFGRSFAPAQHRCEIAVVDSAGNTVVRIGRFGNVDDGMPLRVADRGLRNEGSGTGGTRGGPGNPKSEIPNPRSIGGDEVTFVSPKWLCVHSDRRLFVADRGNYRVVSVKLGYHAEEKVALKDVKDLKK
jgi:hypothetical protein